MGDSPAKVEGAHQTGHQQERCEFDSDQVRPVKREADLLRVHHDLSSVGMRGGGNGPGELGCENQSKNPRADPNARSKPALLDVNCPDTLIQQHHNEHKQHDNRACINDDFESSDKRRADEIEDHGKREQRHDQVKQAVYRV